MRMKRLKNNYKKISLSSIETKPKVYQFIVNLKKFGQSKIDTLVDKMKFSFK